VTVKTKRTGASVFDLEGFIQDFVTFAKLEPVQKLGFQERVVRMKTTVYGDIASAIVLYEAQIPGHPMGPQQGVDIWQLIRKDGKWSIVSIVNEIVTKENPLPPELREPGKG
jgi:hypothetical protein